MQVYALGGTSLLIPASMDTLVSYLYFRVHTDNLAKTAFNDFVNCLHEFGIPSHVRADAGGEFTHIEKFMKFFNGEGRGSFISGQSVHNQRIERLWRDVFTQTFIFTSYSILWKITVYYQSRITFIYLACITCLLRVFKQT